jgi:hypothetical protein
MQQGKSKTGDYFFQPKYVETRCGKLSKCALFLQDDALLVPLEKSNKTVFKIADHLAYSLDLVPSDYYQFSKLKKVLKGRRVA